MVSNSILKANARKQLGGNITSSNWLIMLAICFVESAVIGAASTVVGIGALLVSGFLSYGIARILLSLIRGKTEIDFADLICAFKEDWTQTLILGILYEVFVALWSLLFIIPGIVKSYSYALCFYIQQDTGNKEWKECLSKSEKMMNGHKWQLFCLDLSFIGWYVLGALCFGVGILFVLPYHKTARANFYEALRATYED